MLTFTVNSISMKTIPLNNKLRYLSYLSTLTDNIKHNSIQTKTNLPHSTILFNKKSNDHGYGSDSSDGYGYVNGNGEGWGYGNGEGWGNGDGEGWGNGDGNGNGNGEGWGYGNGNGNGSGSGSGCGDD